MIKKESHKKPKSKSQDVREQIPFDEALRKLVKTPPAPKKKKKEPKDDRKK